MPAIIQMNQQKILALNGLSKTFGSVIANRDVSLDLYRGEVLALLGENGAGKTTLMNMIFGHYMPDSGSVDIENASGVLVPLSLGNSQSAIAAGIGMVHQHFTLAENLDALDNIMLGAERLKGLRRNKAAALDKVKDIMLESGLSAPLTVPVGRLTVGERQRIEILKALYRNVKILVLDEPTAVLTPQEADTLFENIGRMTKNGLSVIFISHKLREVLAFSHRIAVLRRGAKVGEIATSQADERKIANMMVGSKTEEYPRELMPPGKPILCFERVSVSGRSRRESLECIDLTVNEHEILGIAGVSGNGQTALAGVISGILGANTGNIFVDGVVIKDVCPYVMLAAGVGRIPEDRHRDGIVGAMSVAENMIIESLGDQAVQRRGLLKWDEIQVRAEKMSVDYDVRGPGIQAPARLLSGGNIQKLILARVFESKPKLILANQPTRGLDMGAAADVAKRLLEARSRGAGVVLISEDLDEIFNLSDRIMVMHDGELTLAKTRDRAELGLLMVGDVA